MQILIFFFNQERPWPALPNILQFLEQEAFLRERLAGNRRGGEGAGSHKAESHTEGSKHRIQSALTGQYFYCIYTHCGERQTSNSF